MAPVTVHVKPKAGKEITLEDLRELVEKTKGLDGKLPILGTVGTRQAKINLIDIEATT